MSLRPPISPTWVDALFNNLGYAGSGCKVRISGRILMSDDPNFNPNGQLNGNWTSLQPVRPQP
jgi:hypothetical protein